MTSESRRPDSRPAEQGQDELRSAKRGAGRDARQKAPLAPIALHELGQVTERTFEECHVVERGMEDGLGHGPPTACAWRSQSARSRSTTRRATPSSGVKELTRGMLASFFSEGLRIGCGQANVKAYNRELRDLIHNGWTKVVLKVAA